MSIYNKLPTLERIIEAHQALKQQKPLVQCLTNTVSVNFMANVLLSAGASPAMVDNPEESAEFVHFAQAVVINLGTPTAALVESMKLAIAEAYTLNKPWVLDPIAAGALSWRGQLAADFLKFKPTVIRGNASEIIGLAGLGRNHKGFDSSDDPEHAIASAKFLLKHSAAVSASGEVDHIVAQTEDTKYWLAKIKGGSYFFPLVTASGCSLGALVAAYSAVTDPFNAVVTAHAHYAVAGKKAHAKADTPANFQNEFVNELYRIRADDFKQYLELSIEELRDTA
ncbi:MULTISPECIES: hydroxyethylthiazole kinase [unclassified Acinetobacter]|uniref:hydroxyethylthiazole kinase n=1 Tax=unclassified Acinetobacter TaxID=196816 RepID=UPI002934FC03|nr:MULTISPECIES: hydroxyethylthiazole kinase [unclassified Acinetobacter]WOE32471.1 hydroxyethylthiazole kinase [Acinetobacter sp. SAAs470]WOE37947.1 hydroxyethylthiazole kinase [Acinetobacter sp. SAAs474]